MVDHLEFDYQELVKATRGFCKSRLIGKGSHGSVYKGVFEDGGDCGHKLVAVKRASFTGLEVIRDNSEKLKNEISVLSSLVRRDESVRNPYLINFLGTCQGSSSSGAESNDNDKLLVMEFMPNGSLHDLLHGSSCSSPPPWPKRVEIAIQIARAIQSLHESNPVIVHRDIKSSNVLFDSNWNAKLADFGLAVSLAESPSQLPIQPAGTIGYLDPCYTTPSKLSTKNDIYSFGVLLLEIISCRKAIDVSKLPSATVEWAMPLIKEKREMEICDPRVALPTYIEGTIRHMLNLAARCVSLEEENRPKIAEILMVETCCIERVRTTPIWMTLLGSLAGSLVVKRRTRKLVKCQQSKEQRDISSDLSRGKMILREILADITLN